MNKHYDKPNGESDKETPKREKYPFPRLAPSGQHRRGPVPKTREEANFEALQVRKRKESLSEKYRKYNGKHRKED